MINCICLAITFLFGIKHDQNLAIDYNFKFMVDFSMNISVSQASFAFVIYMHVCVSVCAGCMCLSYFCVCVLLQHLCWIKIQFVTIFNLCCGTYSQSIDILKNHSRLVNINTVICSTFFLNNLNILVMI